MGVSSEGEAERPRQAEVSQLYVPFNIDQQVLGLEVTVKDSVRVAVSDALQQLVQVTLK